MPDIQLLEESNQAAYVQSRRYVYKHQGVKISRSARIEEEVVIGRGSIIGSDSSITKSIIGKENKIGSGVVMNNSHIWNSKFPSPSFESSFFLIARADVIIEDDVTIHSAIICDRAIIRRGSVIPRGSIISFGVEVGPNTCLPEYVRLTKVKVRYDAFISSLFYSMQSADNTNVSADHIKNVDGVVWSPEQSEILVHYMHHRCILMSRDYRFKGFQ